MGTTGNGWYVALLRAINVGGKNKVPMADLRATLEAAGYAGVATYIQSGNVLLQSDRAADEIEAHLAATIEDRFGFPVPVVVRSHEQLRSVVERAPDGFGAEPERFHSDVIFVKSPLTVDDAMEVVRVREGVDQAWAGDGALYFARLSERRAQSLLTKVVGTKPYRLMTIRNWRTTTTLLTMLDERTSAR